ncbi:universal stress protein [Rhodobacterales bacterium HKCCE2091]|nr:universal stress protein [Rhodobacterales bacterium HKCCE2091]
MYTHIMAPVDLGHAGRLDRALKVAADLAKLYGADITYVGVTGNEPSSVAHTPAEFTQKLEAFAETQAAGTGVPAKARAITAHDPAVDLDGILARAVDEIDADLVVMGTHLPGRMDWPSHGGKLASHSKASVFLVRS